MAVDIKMVEMDDIIKDPINKKEVKEFLSNDIINPYRYWYEKEYGTSPKDSFLLFTNEVYNREFNPKLICSRPAPNAIYYLVDLDKLIKLNEINKRQSFKVFPYPEESTSEDSNRRPKPYMWHHLKFAIKKDRFNQNIAFGCKVKIDFLDKYNNEKLCPQIQAHWTDKEAPLDHTGHHFAYNKMANCQITDIGFSPEKLDILIKFDKEDSFLAADPEVIYRWIGGIYTKESTEMQELTIHKCDCMIKVELESKSLHENEKEVYYFEVKNPDNLMQNIEIIPLSEIGVVPTLLPSGAR